MFDPIFCPDPRGTTQITASTSSSRVALANSGEQVRVINNSTDDVFIELGDSSVTAAVPSGATAGSMRVKPGAIEVFTRKPVFTHVAGITSSGGGTVDFTTGSGA